MTVLDWVLVVVWLGITLSGFWKGAVRLVFGVGGLIVGLWLAAVAGGDVAAALSPIIGVRWLAVVVGWLGVLVITAGLCMVAGWGLERTLRALHLGWLNRLFGAALAGCAALLLLAVFVVSTSRVSPTWRDLCARSTIPPRLIGVLDAVVPPPGRTDDAPSPTAVEDR